MAECQQFEKRVRPSKETAVEREAARKTFVCSVHSVILYRMLYGMELGMYSSQKKNREEHACSQCKIWKLPFSKQAHLLLL
jgi:hypothetical protein